MLEHNTATTSSLLIFKSCALVYRSKDSQRFSQTTTTTTKSTLKASIRPRQFSEIPPLRLSTQLCRWKNMRAIKEYFATPLLTNSIPKAEEEEKKTFFNASVVLFTFNDLEDFNYSRNLFR